jgi:hypothetical protein
MPAGDEVGDNSVSNAEGVDELVITGVDVLVMDGVGVLIIKDVDVLVEVDPNPGLALTDGISPGPPGLPPAPVEVEVEVKVKVMTGI